jgi:hypothetical protein
MPTSKTAITINVQDATGAMPVASYSDVILIGAYKDNTNYNVVSTFTSQAALTTVFTDATTPFVKAAALAFAQGLTKLKVVNTYKDAVDDNDVAVCLSALITENVSHNIIIPIMNAGDEELTPMITHAMAYNKILVVPLVNATSTDAGTAFGALTGDEAIYAVTHTASDILAGELAGAVGAVIAQKKPWISPEWATITGIAISGYTETEIGTLDGNQINTIIAVGTSTVLSAGRGLASGTWTDIARTKQYLQTEIETALINLKLKLAASNQKIPYTSSGIKMIGGSIEKILRQGQTDGAVREDYVDTSGVLVSGYIVAMPDYEDISSSDLTARLLQGISITAYLAGSISTINMTLVITL